MNSFLKDHMPGRFKRVARTMGYALLLGDAGAWHGLSVVLTARLTDRERAAMAWAVLRTLTPDQAADVANTVIPHGAGMPVAPLFGNLDAAAFWADLATPEEVDAYCVAAYNAMAPSRQAAFLDFAQGRLAA